MWANPLSRFRVYSVSHYILYWITHQQMSGKSLAVVRKLFDGFRRDHTGSWLNLSRRSNMNTSDEISCSYSAGRRGRRPDYRGHLPTIEVI